CRRHERGLAERVPFVGRAVVQAVRVVDLEVDRRLVAGADEDLAVALSAKVVADELAAAARAASGSSFAPAAFSARPTAARPSRLRGRRRRRTPGDQGPYAGESKDSKVHVCLALACGLITTGSASGPFIARDTKLRPAGESAFDRARHKD